MFVPKREKRCGFVTFVLRWNRWNLADWGPEVPSIKDQNLRLKWHQNNDSNKISKTISKKIGYQMFNPIPPSSWNLKTWRPWLLEFCPHVCRGSNMPYLQAALWKGSAFGTHLLYIQHCCFFLQMEGRGSITIGTTVPTNSIFKRHPKHIPVTPSPPAWRGGPAVPPERKAQGKDAVIEFIEVCRDMLWHHFQSEWFEKKMTSVYSNTCRVKHVFFFRVRWLTQSSL